MSGPVLPCLVLWLVLSGLIISLGWGESFPIWLLGRQETGSHQQELPKSVSSPVLWARGEAGTLGVDVALALCSALGGRALRLCHMKEEGGTKVLIPIFVLLVDTFKCLTNI